jgi:glycosyltransferase involved in cell wall biosynthesis
MNPAPRVLLLCDRLDVAGGVERFVCNLANHFASVGLDVAVGSVNTARADIHYPLHERVRVVHGAQALHEGDGAWGLLRKQWRTGRALAGLIRQERADAVILNGLTTGCSTLLMLPDAAARHCICCDHNHFTARSKLWRWLRARLYPKVAAVVSLSQADAPRFAAINPRTEVIVNASSLHAETHAAVAEPVVLAVGRHVAQKGFDLLLQAWAAVQAQMPQARLRVLGDGPLRAELQQQAQALGIAASVQWLPPTQQVKEQYAQAAVFVLPSRYEGMPLALLEAQALGVPAVAFDCPTGPAEIINADTGIAVPLADTQALASALLRLLADAPLRARMGAAAIARSRAAFSAQQHFQRWTALVQRVAAEAGR